MQENKPYSYELEEVLSYMKDILTNEFPTDVLTIEHLIVSILDTKGCHANMILDNCLMSENMEELREIYVSMLEEDRRPIINANGERKLSDELSSILDGALREADRTSSQQVGSEHVLLSLLNPQNEFNASMIFSSVGINYDFIFDKTRESKPSSPRLAKRRRGFINNNGGNIDLKQNNPGYSIPLKSEVNTMAVSTSDEYVSKYCTNVNKLINEGKADDLIGRDNEMSHMIKVLARRRKNNVILIGKNGVGKTSIVYKLAQLIEDKQVPQVLEGKEIVSLDIMSLISGTHFRGTFEERVKGLFDELKNSKKYILFIDDIQGVLKGSNKERDTDISGMIGEILSEGDVRIIGTTNYKDYRTHVESNPNISNKFQKIIIEPSSIKDSIEIVNKNKHYYEEYHGVKYTDEAIKTAVELADRYITDRCLPDSAFDIIDLSGAYSVLEDESNSEITSIGKRLADVEKEKEEVLNNGDFERVDALVIEEKELNRKIKDLKNGRKHNIIITPNNITSTVSEMVNVPISRLSHNEIEKVSKIDKTLKEYVIGQDDAVDNLCRVIKRNAVGLGNKSKIKLSALFIGKSGVGKTFLAKKIAEQIFGDEKALIRIDMSEYSEKNSVSKLHGTSQGYIGYDDGGVLTNAIKQKPYSVVLLDEIEKADDSIFNVFLQVFDEGRLTEANGNVVDCKNCIFIMTSNVGTRRASEFGGSIGFSEDTHNRNREILEKELKKKFNPEFLNRIDQIVYFNDLTEDNLKDIVKLEINNFSKRLKEIKYNLVYDDSVVDFIHKESIKHKDYGARPIIRLIQDNIEDSITDMLLANQYDNDYTFSATCVDNKVLIR